MNSFNSYWIPFKKLRKICYCGVTIICLLYIYFILRFTKHNSIRNPADLQLLENIDDFQVTAESTLVKSLKNKARHFIRKQTGIELIKKNDSHHHNDSTTSAIKTQTWIKKFVPLARWKPFRFFIYDLPPKFNDDMINCLVDNPHYRGCFDLTNNGIGKILSVGNSFLVTDSNQFSLEVIIHKQLLHHPYRTINVSSADAFYVPAYMGLACFCFDSPDKVKNQIEELYKHLNNELPFQQSKPHFSTLAKIEREQASKSCPLLKNQESRKLTFIGIERETNTYSRRHLGLKTQRTIVAPYPSYIHYSNTSDVKTPGIHDRNVFVFLAASVRRTNYFRAILIDQFENKTQDSYEDFYNVVKNKNIEQVMLVTRECLGNHKYTTIPWMMRSVFCLQPPGDSPTRKSFYDAILSRCIPVLFHYENRYQVSYPFEWHFNYTDFTVILPAFDGIATYPNVFETLSQISSKVIERLHKNLDNVAKYFQYGVISGPRFTDDAMTLLLKELRHLYNK